MKCAWNELLSILPPGLRQEVDRQAPQSPQEIRMRLGRPVEILCKKGPQQLSQRVTEQMLSFTVNTASRYSPWLAATSAYGYISAPGGHRVGMCGEAVIQDGNMTGFRTLRSLHIRVAREVPGFSGELGNLHGSVLIIGKPGSGKTTLLRDLISRRSYRENIAVVDQRGELFPSDAGFESGPGTDVLTGCSKSQGIDNLLRTMGPDTIAVDEITAETDCHVMLHAGWCGVSLLATAHASSREELIRRPIYRPILESGLFDHLVTLRQDRTWKVERMVL